MIMGEFGMSLRIFFETFRGMNEVNYSVTQMMDTSPHHQHSMGLESLACGLL